MFETFECVKKEPWIIKKRYEQNAFTNYIFNTYV